VTSLSGGRNQDFDAILFGKTIFSFVRQILVSNDLMNAIKRADS
jgi:hypothetical protein